MNIDKVKKILGDKKKLGGVIVIIVAIILAFFVRSVMMNGNLNGENKNIKELVKDKEYKNLTFSDIEVLQGDSLNHIALNIYNNSNKDFKEEVVRIVFKKRNGDTLEKVDIAIPDIKANEESRLDMIVQQRTVDAYTFTISKVKTED